LRKTDSGKMDARTRSCEVTKKTAIGVKTVAASSRPSDIKPYHFLMASGAYHGETRYPINQTKTCGANGAIVLMAGLQRAS
jgi:hypothetical protein